MLWPDADEVGIAAMKKVAEILRKVGTAKVITIITPKDVPPGWDLADADWTPEQGTPCRQPCMGEGLPRGVFTDTSTGARGGVQPSERCREGRSRYSRSVSREGATG